ncbi:hypothetical protein BT69DRAFT_1353950 [Atractiella rhizophila]|nr:hypothetical protein BT69DRAFT_1353950 [Atractiella rhizophila]
MEPSVEGVPRSVLIPSAAAALGLVSGLIQSGKLASLQFRAENAHRPPKTIRGWYSYRRAQNYKIVIDGAKGAVIGARNLGGWTAGFYAGLEGCHWVFSRLTKSLLQMDTISRTGIKLEDIPLRGLSGLASGLALGEVAVYVYGLSTSARMSRLIGGAAVGLLLGSAEEIAAHRARRKQRDVLQC